MKTKNFEMDMTHGSIPRKMVIFAIPIMLSGLLQLLFNAADVVVVGRYVGYTALAAVGSTGSLIGLIVNAIINLSVGTDVVVARSRGEGNEQKISDSVHTAITLALIGGFALVLIGNLVTRPLLILTGSPENVIDQAAIYMRIYFCGMPATMLYNFGSACLRAVGDTRRPMNFLIIAGISNVIMNLFFVIVLKIGVAGVALATVLSQAVSAALVIICLLRADTAIHLDLRRLRIHRQPLREMMRIGVPAGIQSTLFNIANVLLQSSVNSFGDLAIAGNSAASNIEGFLFTSMNAFYQASQTFTSQNYGAGKYSRIHSIWLTTLLVVSGIGLVLGGIAFLFGPQLIGIYSTDPDVIAYGMIRMKIVMTTYVTCGLMNALVGPIRGMGYSIIPTIVSLVGACLTRIIWIMTVFRAFHTLEVLYWCLPISWILTALAHVVVYFVVSRKLPKEDKPEIEAAPAG